MYYVYELFDPRDDRVFYIGKGMRARIDQHEIEAASGRISRKCDKIREIEASGFKIGKRKVETFGDEQAAFDYEAELVSLYGLANLTNVIPGGGVARGAPTTWRDREYVKCAAEIINRTRNGNISAIFVAGRPLDLLPIIGEYKRRAFAVIARRGVEWANAISSPYGVVFDGHP